MLLVSKRCGESVYSVRYSVCFAARFPTLPVHAACPPSLVCERSVRGGLFRGFSSCTITLIFTFAYLRQPWIYDLTFSFDCDIDCICTFEIDLVNTHQFGYSQARFLCGGQVHLFSTLASVVSGSCPRQKALDGGFYVTRLIPR